MRRSQETFDNIKAATAGPAMVLSIALIPLIIIPFVINIDGATATIITTATWMIWAAFVAEYLLLLAAAPNRWHMVRTHLFELALIALPMLRPFRALRAIQLLRVGAGLGVAVRAVRTIASRRSLQGYGSVLAVVIFGGALLTYLAERDHTATNIASFGDALWWAIVTATTVGYGDHYPVTAEGRAVGLILMLLGIGLLSIVTASVAAYFVETDDNDDLELLQRRLDEANAKLDQLLTQNRHEA